MRRILASLILSAACAGTAIADSTRPLQGNVILVHNGSSATFLWNATPYVAQLVSDKVLGAPGLAALEGTSLAALQSKAQSSTATSVSLRVLYEKTGAVSPAYGAPTLQGMENLLTITADRKQLLENATAWIGDVEKGAVPPGLKIDVTGALPPAQ